MFKMHRFSVLFLVGLLLIQLGGCGRGSGEADEVHSPYHLTAVFALTDGQRVPVVSSCPEVSGLPAAAGSSCSFIEADGDPALFFSDDISDFSDKNYTESTMERIRIGWLNSCDQQVAQAAPDSDEIDMASALILASRFLKSEVPNTVVIYADGRSTTGAIDFTKTAICDLDVDASVAAIAEAYPGVDFRGAPVRWIGLGAASGDQKDLTVLQLFYKTLLEAWGAGEVVFDMMPPATAPDGSVYRFDARVSPIQTQSTGSLLEPELSDIEPGHIADTLESGTAISLRESVSFQPDSFALIDPEAAREALSGLVETMRENPDLQLLVAGTTAKAGSLSDCNEFSRHRAEAVGELLVSMGVSPDRFVTIGLGYDSPLYVNDCGPDGRLIQEKAVQNRCVYLINYDSELAQQLLG